jgi:hypothetical protein
MTSDIGHTWIIGVTHRCPHNHAGLPASLRCAMLRPCRRAGARAMAVGAQAADAERCRRPQAIGQLHRAGLGGLVAERGLCCQAQRCSLPADVQVHHASNRSRTAPTHNLHPHLAAFYLGVSISSYPLVSSLTPVSSSHSRLPYPRAFSLTKRASKRVSTRVDVDTQRGPARTVGLVLNGPSCRSVDGGHGVCSPRPARGEDTRRAPRALEMGQSSGKDQSRDVSVSDFGKEKNLFGLAWEAGDFCMPL